MTNLVDLQALIAVTRRPEVNCGCAYFGNLFYTFQNIYLSIHGGSEHVPKLK